MRPSGADFPRHIAPGLQAARASGKNPAIWFSVSREHTMSSSINDQILASRQQTWNGFCKLLLWGTILVAISVAVAVAFAY
jgi:hypothetical protein